METDAQPFSWLLIALFTATLARTVALGLALVAAIRWYVRRPGTPTPGAKHAALCTLPRLRAQLTQG